MHRQFGGHLGVRVLKLTQNMANYSQKHTPFLYDQDNYHLIIISFSTPPPPSFLGTSCVCLLLGVQLFQLSALKKSENEICGACQESVIVLIVVFYKMGLLTACFSGCPCACICAEGVSVCFLCSVGIHVKSSNPPSI